VVRQRGHTVQKVQRYTIQRGFSDLCSTLSTLLRTFILLMSQARAGPYLTPSVIPGRDHEQIYIVKHE
jgi:hypothetical protein